MNDNLKHTVLYSRPSVIVMQCRIRSRKRQSAQGDNFTHTSVRVQSIVTSVSVCLSPLFVYIRLLSAILLEKLMLFNINIYKYSSTLKALYDLNCVEIAVKLSQNRTSKFHQIFCTSYLWPWLGPSQTPVRQTASFSSQTLLSAP